MITNKTNLPKPIYRALCHSDYDRGESNRSATQLIDSPRVSILRKEHRDEITTDCSEMVWACVGTSVHALFERHSTGESEIPEQRLFAEVDGWNISGAIDLQVMDGKGGVSIYDYKVTSVWSVIYGKPEWVNQLNFYAWLVEQNTELSVNSLNVLAVLKDWRQREADTKSDYPQSGIVSVPIELWTREERDAYVRERVDLHQDAEYGRLVGEELPPCSAQERWEKPATFALKKGKNKRAIKLFSSHEDAQAHIDEFLSDDAKKYWIEERPGEPVRCMGDWCKVSAWCKQFKEIQDAGS